MNYLVSIANRLMSVGSLLDPVEDPFAGKFGEGWLQPILSAIQTILWPLLIVVGSAGTIYAIVLGVNMARADSTEKREEAKKRLINVVVGIAITVGLILFFQLLVADNGILRKILFKDS